MKRAVLIIGLIAGGLLAAGLMYSGAKPVQPKQKASKPAAKAIPKDPLIIEAIRERQYPGSDIVTEQELGSRGNYREAIVSYRSDGLKINALMSTPATVMPASGWPVIILDHGYIPPTEYRTASEDYREFITAFTGAGFMVVKPDYRGHGTSEGSPEGGHFSPVYTYDNLNLITSLKRNNEVDASRIGLLGHSLGAHIALRSIVVSNDVKASVMMSGVVGSFEDLFYSWRRTPNSGTVPQQLIRSARAELVAKYGDPKANPSFWKSASATTYVGAVKGPVQIHHSEGDSVVPKLFSDRLASALKEEKKVVEYFVYPGDDHQFIQNRRQMLDRTTTFFQTNL